MQTVSFSLAFAAAVAAAGCSSEAEPVGGSGGRSGSAGTSGGSGGSTTAGTSGGDKVGGTGGSGIGGSGGGSGGSATTGAGSGGGNVGGSGAGGNAGGGGSAAGNGGAGGGSVAVAGPCMPALPHGPGDSTVTLQSSGVSRTYELHIPPSYDGSKRMSLVFDVHGLGSWGKEQMERSKWDDMADKEGFVLIDPNGINNGWSASGNENDVTFFRDMVKKTTAELCIDSKRVYVSGHSFGGAMTFRLACEAADIFAAAAPVCGWTAVSSCKPSRPIAMLPIRATGDGTVPYNGRAGVSSAAEDVKSWMGYDMCEETPVVMSANGVCTTHTACAPGTQVMECHPAGGHNFFYATTNLLVPDTVWPFFKQFSLP